MTAPAPGAAPGRLHRVCGLVLESPFPLPLPCAAMAPDVRLVRGAVPEVAVPEASAAEDPPPRITAEGEIVLAWRGLGAFRVGRRRVVFDPLPGAAPEAMAAQVLGPVLAVLLHLRGVLPLHASAVATAAGAAAFLGFSGAGKSTVAAALVRRGARLLADDVTAVASGRGEAGPRVLPGVSELRLWPDAAAAVGWAAARGAAQGKTVFPAAPVRAVSAAAPRATAVPLTSVWILEPGSGAGIEALSPRVAAAELLRHAWTSRLVGAEGMPAAEAAAHLERCVAVAAAVPVHRVGVGDLAALPELSSRLARAIALD